MLPAFASDNVEEDILLALSYGREVVVVEEPPKFPGCLIFQPWEMPRQDFYRRYSDWVSRHLTLNRLFTLEDFLADLDENNTVAVFAPSTRKTLESYHRYNQPLEIEGYELRSFQNFCLNQAIERSRTGNGNAGRYFFWNWSPGAGKSFISAAGAKVLVEAGDVDMAIVICPSPFKEDLRRFYDVAELPNVINDHAKPDVRKARYQQRLDEGTKVFVMNYEKLRTDFSALSALTKKRRVLFVVDEVHSLLSDGAPNQARKCLDKIVKACAATMWALTATPVNGNALRYRDVFSLDGFPRKNPLGTKTEFVKEYTKSVTHIPITKPNGASFDLVKYEWDRDKLHEVRHRVSDRTVPVRKSDRGVREQFKGLECFKVEVPATRELRELYSIIRTLAAAAREAGEPLAPYVLAMRIAAVCPEFLHYSQSPIVQFLAQEYPQLCTRSASNKVEMLNEQLRSIREAGDQALVFCHWTNMGILPLAKMVDVPHVLHYGVGQSAQESQEAKDSFKSNPDITAFLTSDAGATGISMQNARYVISVDPVYSYDLLSQRNARIDRVDSHLDGLTAQVMVTQGIPIENRIWNTCEKRRLLSESVQGTREDLSYHTDDNEPPPSDQDYYLGLDDEGSEALAATP
ncbi:DNA helicase [Gordonia phage Skog]|uniref:DNA helicase n=1 Tax=Gordonia phage Skog TaxID=2704033 RepID=A0A6G6XJS5_9CAUD|nr:DNA helicase [Gordonia phage Skog]QIG58348.1 DNA helicase [Gordonia phage Skog]